MNWIDKIAFHRNIRNETPNKELAEELATTENKAGIREIAHHLYDKNKSVASDCLAVLYTIGYSKPELIQEFADDFLKLLSSKNNRMVWGSMIALSTLAPLKPDHLFTKMELLLKSMREGTLITEVWGIKTLTSIARCNPSYKKKLLPVLIDYLEQCRPIDFASRVETIQLAMTSPEERATLDKIIASKRADLSAAQAKKLNAVLKSKANN